MRAFVVLGLVFSIPSQEIGLGKRLRNDLFCVEWDIKPQLSQSVCQTWSAALLTLLMKQVCDQLPTSAVNMTLHAFAAERCAAAPLLGAAPAALPAAVV